MYLYDSNNSILAHATKGHAVATISGGLVLKTSHSSDVMKSGLIQQEAHMQV